MNRLAPLPLAALAAAVALAADPPKADKADKPTPATPQEVIYLSADGPIRVRLHASVDGESAETKWRAALDTLFDFCDRNGDGGLDESERATFAAKRNNNNQFVVVDMAGYMVPQFPQVKFTPGPDGKVTKDAFAAGFRDAGMGAVSVDFRPPRGDSQQLTDALYKAMDADGDGKLTAAELKTAAAKLAHLDVDEDEVLTSNELLGNANTGYGQYAFAVPTMVGAAPPAKPTPSDFVAFKPGDRSAVKGVVAARDKDKDGGLTRDELGLPADAFTAADADADGRLDADELAGWLRGPADVDLRAHLGEKPTTRPMVAGRPAPVLEPVRPIPAVGPVKAEADGSYTVANPDARLTVAGNNAQAGQNQGNFTNSVSNMRTVFKTVTLGKGEISRKAVADNGNLRPALPLFDFCDRNRDAKVTTAELDAAIAAIEPGVNCRSAVVVQDNGRGLFEVLDENGDSRLSPRELLAAPAVVAAMDRNKDAKLAKEEVRRSIAVSAEPRSIDVIPMNGYYDGVVSFTSYSGGPAMASGVNAPQWFSKMDRNGDGDVSAREFLGPPALFKKLDTDGDGLLSPAEARVAPK